MIRTIILRTALVAAALTLLASGTILAQEASEVDGTADFRNPPLLSDGRYLDTIVSGEAVWYSVIYTNDDPYRIEVDLVEVDLDADDELELEARLIGPTLGAIDSGRVLEGSASYSGGRTNLWYIEVVLSTTGRLGVEHTLSIDIAGMQSGRLERCEDLPDCDLDVALAALDDEVASVVAAIDELPDLESEEVVRDQISELERRVTAAAADLEAAEARIAEICAPAVDCDSPPAPGAATPLWAMVIGALVLAAGAGLLVSSFRGG